MDGVCGNSCQAATEALAKVVKLYQPTWFSRLSFSALLFVIIFLLVVCDPVNAGPEVEKCVVSQAQITTAIRLATMYLVRANDSTGRFVYRVDLSSSHLPTQKYNIIRHAGVIYALAQAWQQFPDSESKAVLRRSARFLITNCIAPIPGHANMLGIWSFPELTHGHGPPKVKLGSVGLGLAALIKTKEIFPEIISLADLRKMGRFLLFMQKSDGRFATEYIPSRGGKNSRRDSLYYPGEAALGLLMLYQIDHSRQWLYAATKGLAYLIRNRKVNTSDQWSIIACAKLISTDHYPETILPRHEVITFVREACLAILEEQILYHDQRQFIGCFNLKGRTTPTATRVEALCAIAEIIGEKDTILKNTILASIRSAVRFLMDAQVTTGKFAGGMPRVVCLPAGSTITTQRTHEIRIDYVQHLLSALLQSRQVRINC
jgi:hypothetical protein